MKVLRYWIISISLASLLGGCSQNALEDRDTQVLIAVGPSNHPPGSHEVAAGARLIEHCLENMENVPGVQADVVYDWSEVPQALDAYATVVFIGDNFPGERLPNSETAMEQLIAMMARGCGIVCVHYGVGLLDEDVERGGDHPLLHWMGGYFASRCEHHRSTAKIYEAAIIEAADPEHPVSRGWDTLTLHDEPYSNIYFGPDKNQLLPGAFALATSMLPPENPKQEIVAWGIERPDTGRGLGVTLPHFYRNWQLEDLRRFILNGIVWTAKREVPEEGVKSTLPDLETFDPESVEFVPKQ